MDIFITPVAARCGRKKAKKSGGQLPYESTPHDTLCASVHTRCWPHAVCQLCRGRTGWRRTWCAPWYCRCSAWRAPRRDKVMPFASGSTMFDFYSAGFAGIMSNCRQAHAYRAKYEQRDPATTIIQRAWRAHRARRKGATYSAEAEHVVCCFPDATPEQRFLLMLAGGSVASDLATGKARCFGAGRPTGGGQRSQGRTRESCGSSTRSTGLRLGHHPAQPAGGRGRTVWAVTRCARTSRK